MAEVEELQQKYRDVAEFVIVYIKEAHPEDEWQMGSNEEQNILYKQPKTLDDRLKLAQTFVQKMDVKTQTLVDDIRNTAMVCYAAWPERIYVIDTDSTIAYKGGMGPFDFKPADLDSFLRKRYARTPATD